MKSNLIICSTPIHMLIAEKIISYFEKDKFDLLVMTDTLNDKYRFYINKLSEKCDRVDCFLIKDAPRFEYLKNFIKFKKKCNKSFLRYDNYFFANITSKYIQYIFSNKKFGNVYTFDDGFANIYKDSLMYNEIRPNGLIRFIWYLLGVEKFSKEIRESIHTHFTIYSGLSNISENLFFLNLLGGSNVSLSSFKDKEIGIFLGQPLGEISDEFSNVDLPKILSMLGVKYYFKHPREKEIIKNDQIEYINSNLIFEDFIIKFIKENRIFVNIYTFSSTAAINVSGLSGVKINFIFSRIINNHQPNLYSMINSMGFNIIEVDVESV